MSEKLLASNGEAIANEESYYQNIEIAKNGYRAHVSSHGGPGAGRGFVVEASSMRALQQELVDCDVASLVDWDANGELAGWRRRLFEAEFRQQYDELVFRTINRLA